jgi:hypothetical protein
LVAFPPPYLRNYSKLNKKKGKGVFGEEFMENISLLNLDEELNCGSENERTVWDDSIFYVTSQGFIEEMNYPSAVDPASLQQPGSNKELVSFHAAHVESHELGSQ